MPFTPLDVAKWMLGEIERHGVLYQSEAAAEIEGRFGGEFVYENEAGNSAISKAVLTEFRRLTDASVVWERRERLWRSREPGDEAGRLQR